VLPQVPQLKMSFWTLTHVPPQQPRPAPQVTQAPDEVVTVVMVPVVTVPVVTVPVVTVVVEPPAPATTFPLQPAIRMAPRPRT
jgi:hypothetical protein